MTDDRCDHSGARVWMYGHIIDGHEVVHCPGCGVEVELVGQSFIAEHAKPVEAAA